jgi:hypothetical protein
MTHYEIIRKAYDECGIIYATWSEGEYNYIVLVGNIPEKARVERSQNIYGHPYMEFYKGNIASY